jgi:CubicO group peptidase (beta-lactamase class C family)
MQLTWVPNAPKLCHQMPAEQGNPRQGSDVGKWLQAVWPASSRDCRLRGSIALVIAALAAYVPQGVAAQDSIPPRIEGYMHALVALDRFSGAVLVARDGRVLYEAGFGLADTEWNVPNSPDTKFRIGSLTKQFTAMAILILAERGRLRLTDGVCSYLVSCPDRWRAITIRELLTHTSGIPDYVSAPAFEHIEMVPTTPRALVDRFRGRPLRFAPGSRFEYSNSGYVLLGLVIERASGQSYEAFLQHAIFDVLHLKNTGYDNQARILYRRASGYAKHGDTLENAPPIDPSVAYAAGALYSTVEDFKTWDDALYTERLVSRAALDDMFTPRMGVSGYGWAIGTLFNRRMEHHNGEISGFVSNIARFPEQHVLVVVLGNREGVQVDNITRDLAAITFGEPYELPAPHSVVALDSAILAAYAGRYRITADIMLTIHREGDHLVGELSGGERTRFTLRPLSETHFTSDSPPVDLVFTVNPQGHATAVTVNGSFTGIRMR